MDKSHPSRDNLTRRASALPTVEGGEVVSEKEVSAFLLDLERLESRVPQHLREQAARIINELGTELEMGPDGYIVPEDILKGLINRAVRAGGAQTGSDIGAPLAEIQELEAIFSAPEDSGEAPAV